MPDRNNTKRLGDLLESFGGDLGRRDAYWARRRPDRYRRSLKPDDAHSETKRNAANEWFKNTLLSRLDDKRTGARPPVMASRSSPSRARNPADRRPQCDSDHLGLWQCWLACRAGSREQGLKIIGIGDHTAALYDPKGFEIRAAIEHAAKHRLLKGCADQVTIDAVELLTRRCDILVPCAVERVIDAELAAKLSAP